MKSSIDLTQGPILSLLVRLAVPLVGASFFQTAYVMVNMAWLGRSGAHDVASAGAAGLFTWFGVSLALMPRVGSEVLISHAVGRRDLVAASRVASNALALTLLLAAVYGLLLFVFAPQLVRLFDFPEADVARHSSTFLRIVALSFPGSMGMMTFSGIKNSMGDSRTPFRISVAGLVVTALLDPLLIFGLGPVPAFGAPGAAIATVFGQGVTFALASHSLLKHWRRDTGHSLRQPQRWEEWVAILKFGVPAALQSATFAVFAMLLARIVTGFGALPLAVQSVGSQIESLTYLTANGLCAATAAFVGQNFGARKPDRILRGFRVAIGVAAVQGGLVGLVLFVFNHSLFALFMKEPEALRLGAIYLAIFSGSQLFMSLELVLSGAFRGLGKTATPLFVSVLLTGARVPMAMVVTAGLGFGVTAVWWVASLSSVLKGVALTLLLLRESRRIREGIGEEGRALEPQVV